MVLAMGFFVAELSGAERSLQLGVLCSPIS